MYQKKSMLEINVRSNCNFLMCDIKKLIFLLRKGKGVLGILRHLTKRGEGDKKMEKSPYVIYGWPLKTMLFQNESKIIINYE